MHGTRILRALGAALIAGSTFLGIGTAAHAAHVGPPCQVGRDTTGSCTIVNRMVTITITRGHGAVVVHNQAYPQGLVLKLLIARGRNSIAKGDHLDVVVTKSGTFVVIDIMRNGKQRRTFSPPITAVPPKGYRYLVVMTRHGWVLVKRDRIAHPGLYKWVRSWGHPSRGHRP